MRNPVKKNLAAGFSLVELLIAMTVTLVTLGIISSLLAQAMGIRARESRTADALTSAQAALAIISREISNSGFGIYTGPLSRTASNGIVLPDSGPGQIRVWANQENEGGTPSSPSPSTLALNQPGEDITYFFDTETRSIVRYDANGLGPDMPQTSVLVNRISDVEFSYFDYRGAESASEGPLTRPTANTGRVTITVSVELDPVVGQPNRQVIRLSSDITLRNSAYMLRQY